MAGPATTDDATNAEPKGPVERIATVAVHFGAIVLQITAVLLVVNALYRYTLGGGFPVITEVTRYAFLAIVFLGLAGTHIVGGHVRVEILLASLPGGLRRLLENYLVPVVSIFYLSLLGWTGWQATVQMFTQTTTTPTRPYILLWPFASVIPIGCGLLIIVLIVHLLRRMTGAGTKA